MSRIRNFVFTWNSPPEDHHSLLEGKEEIAYIIYQVEEASKKHLQGYIELKNQTRFLKVANWFPWHIEKRKGTQDEAISYCSKTDTRIEGPYEMGQKKSQGNRTDIVNAYKAISEGKRKRLIAEEMPLVDVKFHRALDRYRSLCEKDSSRSYRKLTVTILHGTAGSGKTRRVVEEHPDCFILNQPENQLWWDGYEGEDVLLIDDFYGWIKWGLFLKVLDGYQLRLPIKGSFTYANWTKIFITSNVHPENWYTKGMPLEFSRRITNIIKM